MVAAVTSVKPSPVDRSTPSGAESVSPRCQTDRLTGARRAWTGGDADPRPGAAPAPGGDGAPGHARPGRHRAAGGGDGDFRPAAIHAARGTRHCGTGRTSPRSPALA